MKSYICPSCKSENICPVNLNVKEFVCKSCSNLVIVYDQVLRANKQLSKPTENIALEIGSKGIIEEIEYTVTGIIVRKYGQATYWREYFLKNKKGDDTFLSESDGHWIFLSEIDSKSIKEDRKTLTYENRIYHFYETTPSSVSAAAGFFEDPLFLGITSYKEYVSGRSMISIETNSKGKAVFFGRHISRFEVKRAFQIPTMPGYYGIGMVQPFYVNIRQSGNILGIAALLICFIQLYIYTSRTNAVVFNETIRFQDVKNKEMVSNNFELKGGSAPMEVTLRSNVDNSWANAELSLVNEKTNEITYTSQDMEYYYGYEDGENWSEGSRKKEFNFCGIAPGKYHFLVSAEKQTGSSSENVVSDAVSIYDNGNFIVSRKSNGFVDVYNKATGNSTTYDNIEHFRRDSANLTNDAAENITLQTSAETSSIGTENASVEKPAAADNNPDIEIIAQWKPVSFWNFGIVLSLTVGFYVLLRTGNYYFDKSKWNNSSNSPYE